MVNQFLHSSIGILFVGSATGVVLGWGGKLALDCIFNFMARELDDAIHLTDHDPADHELVLAMVKWADAKIPGAGKGKEKFALVASKIANLSPFLANQQDRIEFLIESAVSRAKELLDSKLEQPQDAQKPA